MTPRRLSLALVLLLLCAGAATPQESPKVFREARRVTEGSSPSFEFELSGFTYRIAGNGAGQRIKGDSVRRFNLRLEGGDYLERVYFARHRENVLLICGVSDGVTGAGFVTRLEQPSMRARWKQLIPAPGAGPGLVEEEHVYLTAEGFIARLDLREGEYVWQHDDLDLPKKGGFGSFEAPSVEGDAVLFREKPAGNSPARVVRVQRRTGKIAALESGNGGS